MTTKKTEQKYKKLSSSADTDGQDFEVDVLTLVYLRMKALGGQFKIASNIDKVFGKFDDIVVIKQIAEDHWTIDAIQLKHKKNKFNIDPSLLATKHEAFGILNYWFIQNVEAAKEVISTTSTSTSIEFKYYIFTNAKSTDALGARETNEMYLSTDQMNERPQYSFNQGTYVYEEILKVAQLKADVLDFVRRNDFIKSLEGNNDFEKLDHFHDVTMKKLTLCDMKNGTQNGDISNDSYGEIKQLHDRAKELFPNQSPPTNMFNNLKGVADLETWKDFLPKVQVFTNQAGLRKLDELIAMELERYYKSSDDLHTLVGDIKSEIKKWWREDGLKPYLTDKSVHLRRVLVNAYNASRTSELRSHGMTFTDDKLTDFLREMPWGGVFHVQAKKSTLLVSILVTKALENAVRLQNSGESSVIYKSEFCDEGRHLIVDVQTMYDKKKELLYIWTNTDINTLVVDCNVELSEEQERSLVEDIDKEIKNQRRKSSKKLLVLISHADRLLKHKRDFKITNNYPDNMNWFDLEEPSRVKLSERKINLQGTVTSLSELEVDEDEDFLLKMDSESCAQLLETETRFGKDLDSADNLFVDRSMKKTDSVHAAVDGLELLSDENSKVVLLVTDPGMGKSTLMTYVASEAKVADPLAWIAFVKLHECVQFFDKYKLRDIGRIETLEFLHKFALSSGSQLEKGLLNALLTKLYIFVDGVDEVCTYIDLVAKLLTNLMAIPVARLWVSTRPICQHDLETKLNVKAHTLETINTKRLFVKMFTGKSLTDRNKFYDYLKAVLGEDLLGSPLIAVNLREFDCETSDVYALYLQCANTLFDVHCKNSKLLLPGNIDSKLWDHFKKILASVDLHELLPEIGGRNFNCQDNLQACVLAIRNAWLDKKQEWTTIVCSNTTTESVVDISQLFYPFLAVFFAVRLLEKYKDRPKNKVLIQNNEAAHSSDENLNEALEYMDIADDLFD